ncbi:MAG: molybdopterin-synthase adenylyltransferase MoeB [Gammaproteobacteria bacterium]|nr:molybdopterin-synthase adenylyltransferase MoeB [Gammaproteobacteria bacterium]
MMELNPKEEERYSRHFNLPQVGVEGQKKLKSSRVLCVGVGGLGSPLSLYLAAAGIGTLGLIDPDRVDSSNLQRQILYTEDDVGCVKVEAARKKLLALNPHIDIQIHQEGLSEENALRIIQDYDIVVDGTDNFPTRFLVNDACCQLGRPNVYASVFQFEGQLSVFMGNEGPCYRCLYPAPPPPSLIPSCAEGGILGVLPGIMGSLQALEVIKLALGIGDSLKSRLLCFDALGLTFKEFEIMVRPDCPICSKHIPFEKLSRVQVSCGLNDSQHISAEELYALMQSKTPFTLLDVREPYEYDAWNLGGELIPLAELPHRINELDPSQLIIVHCKVGIRSQAALEILQKNGFARVKNLSGGIMSWTY